VTFRILYTHSYNRKAEKFISRHPDLLLQYEKTLKLLQVNPFHASLRLHRLKGPLKELHSVSINISYRITLEFLLDDMTIIPVDVEKHGDVY
jgi:proteic killer suppression protein